MVLKVFGHPISPPFRLVLMTLESLGDVEYEVVVVDCSKGEHLKPDFVKMNPQHTIPVMVDGDLVLNESRAIAAYLVNKYGGDNHPLYPSDPAVRAVIDQRINFEMGFLYQQFMTVTYPQFLTIHGIPPMTEREIQGFDKKLERLYEVLGWADAFARSSLSGYIADTASLSLADLALAASYSTVRAFGRFQLDRFESLNGWLERVEREVKRYKEVNQDGADEFGTWFKQWRKKE